MTDVNFILEKTEITDRTMFDLAKISAIANIELLAIKLYESTQLGNLSHGWLDKDEFSKNYWRENARNLINEQL